MKRALHQAYRDDLKCKKCNMFVAKTVSGLRVHSASCVSSSRLVSSALGLHGAEQPGPSAQAVSASTPPSTAYAAANLGTHDPEPNQWHNEIEVEPVTASDLATQSHAAEAKQPDSSTRAIRPVGQAALFANDCPEYTTTRHFQFTSSMPNTQHIQLHLTPASLLPLILRLHSDDRDQLLRVITSPTFSGADIPWSNAHQLHTFLDSLQVSISWWIYLNDGAQWSICAGLGGCADS